MGSKVYVAVRFDREVYELMKKVAEKLGVTLSDFVRMAVREKLARMSFLDDETKKVFGIKETEKGEQSDGFRV